MKLSLRINEPDDSSGTNEGDSSISNFNFEKIACVLERELAEIYPASQDFEAAEISLTFAASDEIQALNHEYRDIDEPTDVLSFPLINFDEDNSEDVFEIPVLMLGDIVICPEETKRLHPELNEREAICLMIAHSFLHLLGYDHDTDEKQELMWRKQDDIKSKILSALSKEEN